ncbi:hypothetical protein NFI96_020112, partial [Prochilodus magdalenae]
AETRLAAKRAARAEAREIRMRELERQQKEFSDDEEQMSLGSRDSMQSNGYDDDYNTKSSRPSEYSGFLGSSSRTSSRMCSSPGDNCSSTVASFLQDTATGSCLPKDLDHVTIPDLPNISERLLEGSSRASTFSTATLTSLGGTSISRGSGDSSVTTETETSVQEIKEIHELKDQIQDVEAKYAQSLKEIKDFLAETEEKYRKAMVSNAQLDNEKSNLMYQVDTLKDSLMELEELLAETRRELEGKNKDLDREKHVHSILQFKYNNLEETLKQSEELLTALERQKEYSDAIRNERDELRDEVVQLRDILKRHGIVLGPDLSTSREVGEDGTERSAGTEVQEGSNILAPQNGDYLNKDQIQNNVEKSPNVVCDPENQMLASQSKDEVKGGKDEVVEDSEGMVGKLEPDRLSEGTADQNESQVSIANSEVIKVQDETVVGDPQDKKAEEQSRKVDKNAQQAKGVSNSSKKKKKKKKNKQKQGSNEKEGKAESREKNENQLKTVSPVQIMETNAESNSVHEESSEDITNENVSKNLVYEGNIEPVNKGVDSVQAPSHESKTGDVSSCDGMTENILEVKNEKEMTQVANVPVDLETDNQVLHVDEMKDESLTAVKDETPTQGDLQQRCDSTVDNMQEKGPSEDLCENTQELDYSSAEIYTDGSLSNNQYEVTKATKAPGENQEYQEPTDAAWESKAEESVLECADSFECHDPVLEEPSSVTQNCFPSEEMTGSKESLQEKEEETGQEQGSDTCTSSQEQADGNTESQELADAQDRDQDQEPQICEEDSGRSEGEQQTSIKEEGSSTPDQLANTEGEHSVHEEQQDIQENEEQGHLEIKDTNVEQENEAAHSFQNPDKPLPEAVELTQEAVDSAVQEESLNSGEQAVEVITERSEEDSESGLKNENKKGKGKKTRLRKLVDERESLIEQLNKLKGQLEQKNKGHDADDDSRPEEVAMENGTDRDVMDLQRDANRQITDLKFKLAKSEQELTAMEQNVTRLEGQVTRYKSAAENAEKVEDELKAEKRKLQRELRSALDKVEELEASNSHLTKRLEKMKANRGTPP